MAREEQGRQGGNRPAAMTITCGLAAAAIGLHGKKTAVELKAAELGELQAAISHRDNCPDAACAAKAAKAATPPADAPAATKPAEAAKPAATEPAKAEAKPVAKPPDDVPAHIKGDPGKEFLHGLTAGLTTKLFWPAPKEK